MVLVVRSIKINIIKPSNSLWLICKELKTDIRGFYSLNKEHFAGEWVVDHNLEECKAYFYKNLIKLDTFL